MSVHISSAVWSHSNSSGSTLLVLISMADQANDEGWCWPSVGNIAKRCRLAERSIQYHLRELEEMGEIESQARPGRSTVYRVLVTNGGEARFTGANTAPPQHIAQGGATNGTPVVQPVAPRNVSESSRTINGPRKTTLPANWQPNEEHRQRAEELGLDLDTQVELFRAHAESTDRRMNRWGAAFTTWLIKAEGFASNGHQSVDAGSGYFSLWER